MLSLIPHALLFQTRQRLKKIKASKQIWDRALADDYRLADLSGLDSHPVFADFRAGWNDDGLLFNVLVAGKKNKVRCDSEQPLESDGLQLWIDTRNTPGVHRANRFCHLFCALPAGSGKNKQQPSARQLEIPRCREAAPLASAESLRCKSNINHEGYSLSLWIPAESLNGFDPDQSPLLGFYYAILDNELGLQTLGIGQEFPYHSDPSLWQCLELSEV
ncbi:MAG TPA: hypothetical protein VMM56_09615 [Planctomycetaceae bacterium]|nr:hypothetical protein [Planctomycetaceae bacterium]